MKVICLVVFLLFMGGLVGIQATPVQAIGYVTILRVPYQGDFVAVAKNSTFTPLRFRFLTEATAPETGSIDIDVSGMTTNEQVRDALITAINANNGFTKCVGAADPTSSDSVLLTANDPGADGNAIVLYGYTGFSHALRIIPFAGGRDDK